jgi:hypothetical protein
MPHIYHKKFLPRLASGLLSISADEEQPNLWAGQMPEKTLSFPYQISKYMSLRSWLLGPRVYPDPGSTFFVTGLDANSTTGVLRQHAMRMNSSVQCEVIERSSFPVSCPGDEPFSVALQRANETNVRVCVPGKVGTFPWTLSRNRQTITEEIYLDIWDGENLPEFERSPSGLVDINTTVRCEAKTTRGYFELGNMYNNNTFGPLLDQWPSPEEMQEDFNDWVSMDLYRPAGEGFKPTEE